MPRLLLPIVLGLLLVECAVATTLAGAESPAAEALRQADKGTFRSADRNEDGKVTRREIIHYIDLVFLSMDADGNERLTIEEWGAWDTGYVHAGAVAGKESQVQEAKRALFVDLDLRDGMVEQEEMSATGLYHFYKADADGNGSLSLDEFTTEFLIPKTLRAAAQ